MKYYYVLARNPHRRRDGASPCFLSRGLDEVQADECYKDLSRTYADVKILYGEVMDKEHFDRHIPEAP